MTAIRRNIRTDALWVALLPLFAAACAPADGDRTDDTASTVVVGKVDSVAAIAPGSTGSLISSPAGADVPRPCTSSQLSASRVGADAGAGQRTITYALRNTGRAPCLLGGTPRVVLVDVDGGAMEEPRAEPSGESFADATTPNTPLVLAVGDSATFQLSFTGISGGTLTCRRATALRMVPPGATDTLTLADTLSPCGPSVHVAPIRAQLPPTATP